MWVLIVVISYFATPPAQSFAPVVAFHEFNTKESRDAAAASFAPVQSDIAKLMRSIEDAKQVGQIVGFAGIQYIITCVVK